MGAQESKSQTEFQPIKKNIIETAIDNLPGTPISTPIDPRSPSVNIARTPVETFLNGEETPKISLETSFTESPKVVLGIDPRSPTLEYVRTPIVVSSRSNQNPVKLQNKNFDNVRKAEIQTTPVKTAFLRHSKIVPPRLLNSSPLTINPNAQKRKSFVGLLETNIDFTETDLDQVALAKNNLDKACTSKTETNIPEEDIETDITVNKVEKVIIEDTISQTELEIKEDKETEINKTKEKSINVTVQCNDFDKKLTNLIYQDESDDEAKLTQRFIKLKESSRTPLGLRNGNNQDEVKKSLGKLKVSDKPIKRQDLSKIPVFKDIKKKGVQCENTPPRNMLENKVTKWDAEKTLII